MSAQKLWKTASKSVGYCKGTVKAVGSVEEDVEMDVEISEEFDDIHAPLLPGDLEECTKAAHARNARWNLQQKMSHNWRFDKSDRLFLYNSVVQGKNESRRLFVRQEMFRRWPL